jgi:GT2 family glycosyltransferase
MPVWRIGAGANMAFRREALRMVGGFDERLGAGRAGCSEDSELWYRMLRAGLTCFYEPRAVTFHRHRGEIDGLRRQMRAYTRGHAVALLAQFERSGDWGNVKRLTFSIPKYYLGRLLGRLTSVAVPTRSTYIDEVAGSIAGIGYYLRHRRSAGAPPLTEGNNV